MRLLSWPKCIGIAGVAGVLFLLSQGISVASRSDAPLLWTRDCALTAKGDDLIVMCGDAEAKIVNQPHEVVAALKDIAIAIRCNGYQTRGLFGGVSLECPPRQ